MNAARVRGQEKENWAHISHSQSIYANQPPGKSLPVSGSHYRLCKTRDLEDIILKGCPSSKIQSPAEVTPGLELWFYYRIITIHTCDFVIKGTLFVLHPVLRLYFFLIDNKKVPRKHTHWKCIFVLKISFEIIYWCPTGTWKTLRSRKRGPRIPNKSLAVCSR